MLEVGEATIQDVGGHRRVLRADKLIRVAVELLRSDVLPPDFVDSDGTLQLDSAGEYRYRFLCAQDEHIHIYERIAAPPSPGFTVGVSAIVTGHAVHPPGTVLPATQEVKA